MATLTLKNGSGQTLATVKDDEVELVDTGQEKEVGGNNSKLVYASPLPTAPEDTQAVTGYAEEAALSEWNVTSVSIPQNFAGMEAIAVPTRLKFQLFDIVEVVENEDYVEITALHMFYRLAENMTLWEPTLSASYTGAAACRNVMTNQLSDTPFKVASDCSAETRLGNEMDYNRRNIVETFLDPESGICALYDLSLIRDNDVFYCLKDVGYDRGFLIENGKNLLGVERRVNIENLVTRVAPVGRDEDGEYVWLNRNGKKYIDSSHINDYPVPRAEIYYTDITIGENGVTADNIQQKLYEEALTRFSIDEADIPEVTMTIQFVSLGDTEEYRQYKDLDKVYLFDILTIKDTIRGYNYAAQVVGVEHNILTGMLESVTIGHLTETDGTRKVATWKVPEINGHKVRHKTIRAGSYEKSSIHTDDIADYAVTSSHMSQSADGHFKTIFAEELYISNTSEDGLLHTEFTVQQGQIDGLVTKTGINSLGQNETLYGNLNVTANRVGMVVGTVHGTDYIKAAEIAVAINQSTGQSEARINADHVYIGNDQSTTVIAGKCSLSDVTASYISGKISEISFISAHALTCDGLLTAGGGLYVLGTNCSSLPSGAKTVSMTTSGNQHTLKYTTYDGTEVEIGTFSVATSLTGAWSGGTFTVTASPQGNTLSTELGEIATNGTPTTSGNYTMTIPCKVVLADGTTSVLTDNITVAAVDAYNNGAAGVTLSEGSWSSGVKTVSASNGASVNVSLPASSGTTWTNTSGDTWRADLSIGGTTRYSTTKDFSGIRTAGYNSGYSAGYSAGYTAGAASVDTTAYFNAGWNACLASCGIAGGGTCYTGTWYGTLYVAPTGGAQSVANCVGQATGHRVYAK